MVSPGGSSQPGQEGWLLPCKREVKWPSSMQRPPKFRTILTIIFQYPVSYLIITNRGDCCSDQLFNFEIRIGNTLADKGNQNSKCGEFYSLGRAETRKIRCPAPIKGRYVNIRMKGPSKILTLCEVEVYAEGNKCSFYRYTNIGNVYGCIYRL